MKRDEKERIVAEIKQELETSDSVIVTDYKGLDVETITNLRSNIKKVGGRYRVIKNTLLRRAIKDTDAASIDPLLVGPTAIATMKGDVVSLAKALVEFSEDNENLKLKGGILAGRPISPDDIKNIASLPGREVLIGRMMGTLNAPMAGLVGVLIALIQRFVFVLRAIEQKKQG